MVGGWPLLAKRRRAPTVREGNWARFNRRVRKKPFRTVGALWGPEGVMRGRCCNVSGVSRSARTPAAQRPFAHLEKGDGPATGWWGATNECPPEIAFLVPRNFGQSNPPRNRFDWGRVKHSTSIIPRVDKQASRRDDVGSLQTGGTKAVLSPAAFAIRWSLGSCQKAKRRPAVRRFGVARRPTPNRVKHSPPIIPRVDKQASRRDDVGSYQAGGTRAVLSSAVFAIRWSLGSCPEGEEQETCGRVFRRGQETRAEQPRRRRGDPCRTEFRVSRSRQMGGARAESSCGNTSLRSARRCSNSPGFLRIFMRNAKFSEFKMGLLTRERPRITMRDE
jgi:hypothetical protein